MNDQPRAAHLGDMPHRGNTTHRKRLARAYADASGLPYAAALERVRAAADAGLLPQRLDDAGITRAVARLRADDLHTHRAADPARQRLAGGARDAIRATGSTELYLIRPYLAQLRKVWQGRVNVINLGGMGFWEVDGAPVTHGGSADIILTLMRYDGYIEAELPATDEWVVARTTDFGDAVLAANGADVDRFRDGLPPDLPDRDREVERDRVPYVGEGSPGAWRSAQIDLEEADGYDADDPRRLTAIGSAERWLRQADRLAQTEPVPQLKIANRRRGE